MIFLPGLIGRFLSYIPITVFITLLAALVLSLTIASALFFKLSKKRTTYYPDISQESNFSDEERAFLAKERIGKTSTEHEKPNLRDRMLEFLGNYYYKLLSQVLHSRFTRLFSIVAPFILLIFTIIFLSPRIWFTLFPASDVGVININVEGQVWAVKETLQQYIPDIETVLSSFVEMKVYYVTLSWNTIKVYVELTDSVLRQDNDQKTVFEVEEAILKSFEKFESAWLLVEVATASSGPPSW
jgi:multidrug efflux pump subunit AcrB